MHDLPKKLSPTVLVALAALGASGAVPGVAAAHTQVAGYVYVNDNTTGTNTVAGFARHADGRLTPLQGSPFAAGGAGTGAGLASQGAIQASSNGRYVLAVDAGSDEISVLRIKHDGGLDLVRGGVVPSGGAQPVSVAEHDGLVYAASAGAGRSNYTGFTLSAGGHLRPLPDSTVVLPDDAQPGDLLFNPTGTNVVGTRVNTSQIDSFSVGPDGRLKAATGSPFAAQAAGPFGSEFRPTNPSQLFVTNAHAGPRNGTVSAFTIAGDGTLAAIGGSPFANDQTAPCWLEITHDGAFLFAVNTVSDTVSRYAIASDGSLTVLGSTGVGNAGGTGAVDARLSSDGRALYVNEGPGAAVAEFVVNGGNLTELGSVPLPANASPAGIAVR